MAKPTDLEVRKHRQPDHEIERIFWERWSPRAMSGEALDDGQLARLFEAARWAPSSFNRQPWRFLYAKRDSAHWHAFFDLLPYRNGVGGVDAQHGGSRSLGCGAALGQMRGHRRGVLEL